MTELQAVEIIELLERLAIAAKIMLFMGAFHVTSSFLHEMRR